MEERERQVGQAILGWPYRMRCSFINNCAKPSVVPHAKEIMLGLELYRVNILPALFIDLEFDLPLIRHLIHGHSALERGCVVAWLFFYSDNREQIRDSWNQRALDGSDSTQTTNKDEEEVRFWKNKYHMLIQNFDCQYALDD